MMTITAAPPLLPCWAILEGRRHGRLAGYYVGEVTVAGKAFLRLDVPDSAGYGVPQYLDPWQIGRILPTTQEDACAVAHQPGEILDPGPRADIQGLWPTDDEPVGAVFGAGEHQAAPEPPTGMPDPHQVGEGAEQAERWSETMEHAQWPEDAQR